MRSDPAESHHCSLPWCVGHLPAERGFVHIGKEDIVRVATPDGEVTDIYVSIEQPDLIGAPCPPSIRIEGAGSAPMSLGDALTLTAAIRSLTQQALEVTR